MSSMVHQNKSRKFSVAIQSDAYQNLINKTLGDPERAKRFVAAITSAVSVNPELQDCDPGTILAGGLLGESLNLSPSPQLGQYYLVPFNDRKNNRKTAQFILGYKGYKQLAIRSGEVRKLNVMAVKEGEMIKVDPFNEFYQFRYIEDDEQREKTPTVGYYAYFETMNGYRKELYWTKKRMEVHALKYSKGYAAKKGYTFWEKDFDAMACKTMIRQLLGKGDCPMSTEMHTAYTTDTAVIQQDMTPQYVEAADDEPIIQGEPVEAIGESGNVDKETGEVAPEATESAEEETEEISLDDL